MKLLRFTATNTQKAMADIFEKLGPEALIYTTRELSGGSVEIVAGLPVNCEAELAQKPILHEEFLQYEEIKKPIVPVHENNLEKLQIQLQQMDAMIKQLSNQITHQHNNQADNQESIQRSVLYHHLNKLNITGKFAYELIKDLMNSGVATDSLNQPMLEKKLLDYLRTEPKEFIDQKNICALVGPTGIGKTTTIAKLAKRYISRYGNRSLGLITTDYNDIARKNHLRYYSNLFDIDLEYANDENELTGALLALKDKKLILMDTHGASQRDHLAVAKLLGFLESQGTQISTYLTLPCNVQEGVLDEIVRAFISTNLRGCLLTKQDESISIAPAVSISMLYQLPIAYVCMGQNINNDIEKAEPIRILHQIMIESAEVKKSTEINLYQNKARLLQKKSLDTYDKQGTF